jgi:hypothetical protein
VITDLLHGLSYHAESVYQHPLAKQKAEPPLKAKESLTIGYGVGAGGTIPPFAFHVSEGRNMEIGFFKLILSTHSVDLQNMVQDVPVFDSTRGMKQFKESVAPSPPNTWLSINILVIQRCPHGSLTYPSPSP